MRKKIVSFGIGLLALSMSSPAVPFKVYAASGSQSANGPSVSEEMDKGTMWEDAGTIMEVMELDKLSYLVTVTVLYPDGKPVSGINMYFSEWLKDKNDTGLAYMRSDGTGNTDGTGRMEFTLPKGSYKLTIGRLPSGYKVSVPLFYDITENKDIVITLEKINNGNSGGSGGSGGGGNGGSGGSGGGGSSSSTTTGGGSSSKPDETAPSAPEESKAPQPEESRPSQNQPEQPSPEQPSPKPENPSNSGPKDEYVVPGKDKEYGTDDDITVRPGKDENGKNNSSQDENGKVDLPDGGDVVYPTQPDQGGISVKVPEGTKVNPDGSLDLPENNQQTEITLPGKDKILGTEDDVVVRPGLDENGKNNTTIDADGKVTLPDGGLVIHPSFPDQGKIGVEVPKGTVILPDGAMRVPNGMIKEFILPGKDAQLETDDDVRVRPELGQDGNDRSYLREDGSVLLPDGGVVTYADGEVVIVPPGTIVLPDGTIIYPEDGASVPVAVTPQGIHFADCWFHWLEILAMLSMTIISMHRLNRIRKVHEELDEMEPENKKHSSGGKKEE